MTGRPEAANSGAGLWHQPVLAAVVMAVIGVAVFCGHRQLPLLQEYRDQPLPPMYHWDSQSYLAMANGQYSEVHSPFSKRALYPFLARAVAAGLGVRLEIAFLGLNLLAFTALAYCLARCLLLAGCDGRLACLFLLTPFPLALLELAYMPDLVYMALTALCFLLLFSERLIWALLVLFIAFVTRESTLLLCLVCAGVGLFRRKRTLVVGSLIVLVAGTLATNYFARLGQPNVHHLPESLYLALKVPYNFILNFLGVHVSSNVIPGQPPLFTWQLPAFLHLGLDREIGVDWDWTRPVATLVVLLALFGTGPLFVWKYFRRNRLSAPAPLAIQVTAIYGLICYVLGPSLGNLIDRLVGYGWPLFWIALPWLVREAGLRLRQRDWYMLGVCYLFCAWWPSLIGFAPDKAPLPNPLPNALLLIPYLVSFLLLRQRNQDRPN
jgi:hypothetical protein